MLACQSLRMELESNVVRRMEECNPVALIETMEIIALPFADASRSRK